MTVVTMIPADPLYRLVRYRLVKRVRLPYRHHRHHRHRGRITVASMQKPPAAPQGAAGGRLSAAGAQAAHRQAGGQPGQRRADPAEALGVQRQPPHRGVDQRLQVQRAAGGFRQRAQQVQHRRHRRAADGPAQDPAVIAEQAAAHTR